MNDVITLAHGSGGRKTSELIGEIFKKNLGNAYFTADDDPLAVGDQAFSDESMSAQAGTITLRNFKPLTRVLVYTTNGTLVKKAQTDVAGFLVFSLQDLPRGIYVVKAGKTTFKAVR